MRSIAVVLVVLAGCTASQQERAEIVCTAFCDCIETSTLPDVVQSCVVDMCMPALTMTVSDECFACVNDLESSCSTLETTCATECLKQIQPGGEG